MNSSDLLARLIAFDTTSALSNLEMMEYIQHYLNAHNIDSQLIFNDEYTKANLYASIGSEQARQQPGILLSGHTDTVPVSGQQWTRPAYQLTRDGDRLYGRGTTDMKGFIACVLSAVPAMAAAQLKRPLHLAFSYDEEIGCLGVRRMLDMLSQQPVAPLLCLIGEPTEMKVVTAHKGKVAARVTVTGKECHSGMAPQGVNAVNYASRLIVWLENEALKRQQQGPFDHQYDVPFTTIHTGTVQGGSALNIVPNHCELVFEIRNIADENAMDILQQFRDYARQLEQQMQQHTDTCAIDTEIITEYPGLNCTDAEQLVSYVRTLTGNDQSGNINFGTEAGLFRQSLGVPSVVCGPGSMAQGHKPDEFIEISQLDQCDRFLKQLIHALSSDTLPG
ncbi:MAG: acetylornithine deacetylase [Oceanospirillaceae bacterium]|nr:acetylornithine deacetylase [Oceanospirillaceae bacterium]MBT10445.1 acetylornithine deacetylase [Oceanospirillaceae bacterium]|tara:strand:+ start:11818 stop:12990 length:1173 start_codon:yes stop_codon:yes gene_type:complete